MSDKVVTFYCGGIILFLKRIIKSVLFHGFSIPIVISSHIPIRGLDDTDIKTVLESKYCFKEFKPHHFPPFHSDIDENIIISFVVPVYNSEKYLEECMLSIIHQDTNYHYECIFVDDGSTDQSPIILNRYASLDNVKIIHQENSGISMARNMGIKNAKGRYLVFVDNDDIVEKNMVQVFGEMIEKDTTLDIIKAGIREKDNDGKVLQIIEEKNRLVRKQDVNLLEFKGYIHSMAIKRSLFDQIRFPECYWYEDMIVRLLLLRRTEEIRCIDKILYTKRKHSVNAANTVWNQASYQALDQVFLVKNIIDFSHQIGLVDTLSFYMAILYELGPMLFQRIRNLDEKTKKMAFNVASEIVVKMKMKSDKETLPKALRDTEKYLYEKKYYPWLLCQIRNSYFNC